MKRKNHETDSLIFDQNAARAIQHEMNRGSFKGGMPVPADRDPTFKNCGESIFYEADIKNKHKVSTSNIATEDWYSGIKEYNFDLGKPKSYPATEFIEEAGECKVRNNLLVTGPPAKKTVTAA